MTTATDLTFTIEVDYTDRTRAGLAFTTLTRRVQVQAPDIDSATLAANQMVAGNIPEDNMIIATRVIEVIA